MQEPFDRRAWAYAMLYVNLYGPQLLYSACKFGQVFLTRTVCACTYMYMQIRTYMYTAPQQSLKIRTYMYTYALQSDIHVHTQRTKYCNRNHTPSESLKANHDTVNRETLVVKKSLACRRRLNAQKIFNYENLKQQHIYGTKISTVWYLE